MKRKITKIKRTISIDRNLDKAMEVTISNKSKYIEWLIYQDLKKYRGDDDKIKKLMI